MSPSFSTKKCSFSAWFLSSELLLSLIMADQPLELCQESGRFPVTLRHSGRSPRNITPIQKVALARHSSFFAELIESTRSSKSFVISLSRLALIDDNLARSLWECLLPAAWSTISSSDRSHVSQFISRLLPRDDLLKQLRMRP